MILEPEPFYEELTCSPSLCPSFPTSKHAGHSISVRHVYYDFFLHVILIERVSVEKILMIFFLNNAMRIRLGIECHKFNAMVKFFHFLGKRQHRKTLAKTICEKQKIVARNLLTVWPLLVSQTCPEISEKHPK